MTKQAIKHSNYLSNISVISAICFHLYRVENDKNYISSEEQFENSKNRSDFYIHLELFFSISFNSFS
jgi:hypothetical protein